MNKVRDLEAENVALKKQLELASGAPSAQRGLDGSQKKVSFAPNAPGFELSTTLAAENSDPNAERTQ